MRIAVIADTHDRLPAHVKDAIGKAGEIWHLGDVCAPGLIEVLRILGRPLRVVRGNCDGTIEWPLQLDFAIEGHRIRLEHIPPARPPTGFDLLLHGHTHIPRDELVGGVRYLNPGSVGRAKSGYPTSYAWLTLERGQPPVWKIVRVK